MLDIRRQDSPSYKQSSQISEPIVDIFKVTIPIKESKKANDPAPATRHSNEMRRISKTTACLSSDNINFPLMHGFS